MPIGRMPTTRVVEVVDAETKHNAQELRLQTAALTLDVEKLYMITEALWSIIKQQNNLTDGHLLDLIREIDERSGKLDGRRKKEAPADCPQCNRRIMSHSTLCLYCGTVVELDPFKKY